MYVYIFLTHVPKFGTQMSASSIALEFNIHEIENKFFILHLHCTVDSTLLRYVLAGLTVQSPSVALRESIVTNTSVAKICVRF